MKFLDAGSGLQMDVVFIKKNFQVEVKKYKLRNNFQIVLISQYSGPILFVLFSLKKYFP